MVALIVCDDISELLTYRSNHGKRQKYTVAWRKDSWKGVQPQLALLIIDDYIRWLGRSRGCQIITDVDRRVEVSDIEEIPAVPLDAIRERLPSRYNKELNYRGVLPDGLSKAVIKALVDELPGLLETINRLNRPDDFRLPQGERGRLLNEQRDGVGLLLEIGGIGRESLRSWSESPVEASFLAGVSKGFASEESLINYDVSRFADLPEISSERIDWRVFEGNGRRMFVMNANMEPIETTLGVDVVYFNETFKSFVLVQYKRIAREAEDGKVWYRPDLNLPTELDRMRVVDELYGPSDGDFRLFSQPCWLKLCDPNPIGQDPVQLIKGMYLAREYFVELLEVCKGPRGGVRIGYDNVPRYMNNTTFIDLVKDGWIGTRSSGTKELGQVIRGILENRRALVLGVSS